MEKNEKKRKRHKIKWGPCPYAGCSVLWLWTIGDYHNIVWRMWLFLICIYIWSFSFTQFILRLTMIASENFMIASAIRIQHPTYPSDVCNLVTFAIQIPHKIYSYYYHFHLQLRLHSNATNIISSESTHHIEWWFLFWFSLSLSLLFEFFIPNDESVFSSNRVSCIHEQQTWIRLFPDNCKRVKDVLNEIGLLSHRHWHMDIKETCPTYAMIITLAYKHKHWHK